MRRTMIAWLLFGLCCAPAQAIIQPRLYDWQARLTRLLPVSIKDKAVNLSEELFEESANFELLHNKVLQLNASIPHEPIELFIGIKLLIKNDAVLTIEKAKEAEYDKALDLLKDDKSKNAQCLLSLGLAYNDIGESARAKNVIKQSIALFQCLYEETGFPYYIQKIDSIKNAFDI